MDSTLPGLNRRLWLAAAVTVGVAAIVGGLPALAHHGWSWAESEPMQLKGTVQKVSMAPPHPSLTVKAADGVVWQVDLANPNQTQRSGFKASSAKAGDPITIIGNRNKDTAKAHMKAVRITVGGKTYDIYPERIPANQ